MEIHRRVFQITNTIRIYGITQQPVTHKYMMVLDFVRVGNLRDYLKNNFNDINWKNKLYYLIELACDFKKIHELNIVHQDLHPGNILFDEFEEENEIRVSNFGFSSLIGKNSKNPEKKKKKRIFGVLPYIAPEVLSGEEYTKAADVYSFAFIAYEIFTGLLPYPDVPHDVVLARKICDGLRPKFPLHTPKLLKRIIMKCWDAQFTNRPTFKEVFDELWRYYCDHEVFKNNNEITIQIKKAEDFCKNKANRGFKLSTNLTIPSSLNHQTHPHAIYTSRFLNFSIHSKPKNESNFEKELEELTKSTSLSIIASTPIETCISDS
ncbi:hypothetical protein Glove_187g72 [Diversispora epigaea]|uniref:Protein kinase domain-containing protein n=1 Tax=Diversispora epigaea TaxID=1348612 RepID=A0A397IPS2_9GLOM|nr:hypothetical protein Glove_187g72 [Diversispora epigaea]